MALDPSSNLSNHCIFVGELPGFELRVNQVAIDGQFEAAAARRLQLHTFKLLLVLSQNFGRQTDGLRFIVSRRAVAKMDFHSTVSS